MSSTLPSPLTWDVFCRVIDNFGDLGVCWRLCADLAARGHTVRLWVDDLSALRWMAPGALDNHWPGVCVLPWERSSDPVFLSSIEPAVVWVEGFGCEIAPFFIAFRADPASARGNLSIPFPVWINLEYLSAQTYVERAHTLPSPILHGPAQGHSKFFFYPGFNQRTGGLLRETSLDQTVKAFEESNARRSWLGQWGIDWKGELLVSMFCYEPPYLAELLSCWRSQGEPVCLLVAAGRGQAAVRAAQAPFEGDLGALKIAYLPAISQSEFDRLLWSCDLNFVRGEDSLTRAIWASKPLVWQIYPQDDQAHDDKLTAFLSTLDAPTTLVNFHQIWNSVLTSGPRPRITAPTRIELKDWGDAVRTLRQQLLAMPDLTTQLVEFVSKKKIKS